MIRSKHRSRHALSVGQESHSKWTRVFRQLLDSQGFKLSLPSEQQAYSPVIFTSVVHLGQHIGFWESGGECEDLNLEKLRTCPPTKRFGWSLTAISKHLS